MTGTVEVVVGRVVKAHGVRGDVTVELHTDEPKLRFAAHAVITVQGSERQLHVRGTHPQGGRLVVTFDELQTRNDAEAIVGAELKAVVQSLARPADDAEFYDRHLIGLAVAKEDGTVVGTVEDVLHGAAQDILVIATDGGQRLVPFVAALVPAVDLDAGRLTVAAVPGLLDDEGV